MATSLQYDAHAARSDSAMGVGNPPFDPRRYSTNPWYTTPDRDGKVLQQGYMVQHIHFGAPTFGTGADGTGGLPWKFRFMYNPSSIAVSYNSPDNSTFPGGYLGGANNAAIPIGQPGPTLTFTLYLDRTYEVSSPPASGPNGSPYSHSSGVLVDVQYFENLVGIAGSGKGPMRQVPIDIYFGDENSLYWFGYISSASVTYGQFSQNMVPMSAELDLTVTQMFQGDPDTTDYVKDYESGVTGVFTKVKSLVDGAEAAVKSIAGAAAAGKIPVPPKPKAGTTAPPTTTKPTTKAAEPPPLLKKPVPDLNPFPTIHPVK